jgi:hypothetical protein
MGGSDAWADLSLLTQLRTCHNPDCVNLLPSVRVWGVVIEYHTRMKRGGDGGWNWMKSG